MELQSITKTILINLKKRISWFKESDTKKMINDSISGKSLLTICKEKWSGPMVDLDIKGSKGLKIAFMAKGNDFKKKPH